MRGRERKLDAVRRLGVSVRENKWSELDCVKKQSRQINRETEWDSKNQDDRSFKLTTRREENTFSLQWNSTDINSERRTAGSDYVGEMQMLANLTSKCLSMPVCTPLITPWGLCHLLEFRVEGILDTSGLVFLCCGFDLQQS